jgi:CheY-like chemotaxis protein
VVEAAIESSRPVIEGFGHDLKVVQPAGENVVDGDVTRLTQVLANLLNNAAKYTEPGGHIRIEIERAAGEVLVKVRDDGAGIPAELQPKLFEMFTRTGTGGDGMRGAGGLGIGLALVKQLVEAHGGSVSVQSPMPVTTGGDAPPRGSEFIVRLPTVATIAPVPTVATVPADVDRAPPMPVAIPASVADDVASPARRRVLVADDNIDAAESLALLLEDLGAETRIAHDGEEALAAAAAFRPDVAFLDLGMPMVNGYDVGRRIRAQEWGVAVMLVALTGWGQPDDRRRSREAGFDQHVVKPASVEMVEKILAAADPRVRARTGDAAATA